MRRIAIVGCRPPPTPDPIYGAIAADVHRFIVECCWKRGARWLLVSGGAEGVDRLAAEHASFHGLTVVEHLPDYAAHGRRAPLVRNELIVADSDEIHAWPAPWSRGTWDTIRKARAAGKPCTVHEVRP